MIHTCQTEQDLQQMLQASHTQPVMLMKHSTRCPVSAAAHREFERFAADSPDVACWQVLVIEARSTSQQVAQETGVTHQSPQVILLKAGKAVWHASHYSITASHMAHAVQEH